MSANPHQPPPPPTPPPPPPSSARSFLSTTTTATATDAPSFQTPRETPSQKTASNYFPIVGNNSNSNSPSHNYSPSSTTTTTSPAPAPSSASAPSSSSPQQPPLLTHSSGDPCAASTASFPPLSSGNASQVELLPDAHPDSDDLPRSDSPTTSAGRRKMPQSWRELRGRAERYFKINGAGAQVAFTTLMVALFTLISPLEDHFPTNTVYLVIATVVVASPNQTISVRLYTQRLIGVLVAGFLSLIVLGLDAVVSPRNCLDCSYKPYAVGLILFFFIYCCVSLRESIPGQAYTSKLTDLTFIITLLGAYDDLRKDPGSKRYAPPLARMASMVVGLLLTMLGSSIFWPIRVNLVHRIVTGNLFKDMASYLHDLIHEGYLQDPSKIPLMSDHHRMSSQWGGTVESIAVCGGMDVIGSEEAAAAPRLALDRTQKVRTRTAMGWVFGNSSQSTAEESPERARERNDLHRRNTTATAGDDPLVLDMPTDPIVQRVGAARGNMWELMFEEALDRDDGVDGADIVKNFHEKTHPAAVHIIRTLEKERARLEASYQVEVRWTQRPHFIRIAPLNQVIRRLRLLFYQLSGLYSDRLITLRALSPRFLDSAHIADNSSMSEWVSAWMADAVALMHVLHASTTDSARYSLERYSACLCNALISLGDVVLWTTSQGHRIIGSAELAARLAVTVDDVLKQRDGLEVELMRIRALLLAAPPPAPSSPDSAAVAGLGADAADIFAGPSAAAGAAVPLIPIDVDLPAVTLLPHSTRVFGAPVAAAASTTANPTPPTTHAQQRPRPHPLQTDNPHHHHYHGNPLETRDPYEETRAILAFQYATYVRLWEITEVVLSSARAVGKLIKVYS